MNLLDLYNMHQKGEISTEEMAKMLNISIKNLKNLKIRSPSTETAYRLSLQPWTRSSATRSTAQRRLRPCKSASEPSTSSR